MDMTSRVRGCVLGQALGDAMGAPFELKPLTYAVERLGSTWIDGLHKFDRALTPHGFWGGKVTGGGTDDTRFNWLYLTLVTELGRHPTAVELAERYLAVYERPGDFFPGHEELAKKEFELFEGCALGWLGRTSPRYPGASPTALRARGHGFNFPTLIGQIVYPCAGLLFAGRPDEAYRQLFTENFVDLAYGLEATAIHAACVAMLAAGVPIRQAIRQAAEMNPMNLGSVFGPGFITARLGKLLDRMPLNASEQETAAFLSTALERHNPSGGYRCLAVAMGALYRFPDDPMAALRVAVNNVGVVNFRNDDGGPTGFQDIDCFGSACGALAGCACGVDAFPAELLEQVVRTNKAVYGFDLDDTARRFARIIHAPVAAGAA